MSAATGDPGIVYILHLDPPYRHARHYTGHAEPGHLAERLAEHGTAHGARLLQVQREAGGSWHLARTLPGGRDLERAIKDAQAVPRYCPDCTPTPRQSPPDVTPRRQRLAARAAAPADPAPAIPLPRLPAPPPAEQGRRAGERFLATRPGWPADRLAAALAYVTGPYRASTPHTGAAAEEMAAFTGTVTAGIKAQRATQRAQPAPTAQQKGTTAMSTPTAQPAPGPATEREKGAATARLIILRQIEAGHSAEQIADRWESALSGHDPQTATPEQQAWHDGAQDEARQLIQDWRDMQRNEAEQAQATRDERQAAQDAEDRRASAARDAGEQLATEPWRLSERELNNMEAAHPEPEPGLQPESPRYLSKECEPGAGSEPEHELEAAG